MAAASQTSKQRQKSQPTRSSFIAGPVTVEVVDYSPQFLAWREAAKDEPDPAVRFALWEELYGEASVPPTAEGRAIARSMVTGAWPYYAQAVPFAERGASGLRVDAPGIITRSAAILELETPGRIRLRTIIGAFDANASAGRQDVPSMTWPLEASTEDPDVMFGHESTHCVHMLVNPDAGYWEQSIAMEIVTEGLGMHVSRALFPGKTDVEYVAGLRNNDRWIRQQAARQDILVAIRKDLGSKELATKMKYRTGRGSAGTQNDVYAAAWWVVEQLQRDGLSLAEIARIPANQAVERVDGAIANLLRA